MGKRSKRYKAAQGLIDVTKSYTVDEAVALLKQTATTKFDASVEIHVRLGIDPKKAEQTVRGSVAMPHGTGKTLRVAVFAKGPAAAAAKEAGADLVGDDEMIAGIKKSEKTDFDVAIATPDMMKSLAPIAKILGTRGLMPNPKNETVTADPAKATASWKQGKVTFRNDETANVHAAIGKASFAAEQLKANLEAFIDALKKAKPGESKGTFLRSITVTSSMGPAIKVVA
jgi:large subunit ribosomal protein L1